MASSPPPPRESLRSVLVGAAFLMATSAIGPGFLTQTTVFTAQMGASFGFAILVSIVVDLVAQLNIWRVITTSGSRAQDLADGLLPGLGWFLTALVVLGGLAFNIGNIAGTGLGLNAMLDLPVATGAALSALLAVGIFVVREAGRAMDRFAQVMGFVMVAFTLYVAIVAHPPLGEAVHRAVMPEQVSVITIITIVGGTVGGYITFAGAHRLLDAGVTGMGARGRVTQSASLAIGVASLMRALLFLAALGIVAQGLTLDAANPPASVFRLAAGQFGYRVFGVVMWAAAITSVVGSAYTSVSFLRGVSPWAERHWTRLVIAFIVVSTVAFLIVGRPVRTLIVVGALNGLVLPVSLGVILLAAHRRRLMPEGYTHPRWLTAAGTIVALAMAAMGAYSMATDLPKLWRG
ncbi:MAG TPA: NRAMP family divalent metal transporter [Gemmatimonadaceae bacterium]|nr:NRAMP family divalent metal transporter [Gemmatimonadaceae bacterium]